VPQLIAIVAYAGANAISALGASDAVAFAVADAITYTAGVAVVAGATAGLAALMKPTPEGLRLTVRQNTPPRRHGVGVARAGGPFLFDYATDQNDLYRISAVIDGPVGNITRFYLSQDRVQLLEGDAVVQLLPNGAYPNNCCALYTCYGQSGVSAFEFWNGPTGGVWGASASGTGIFMIGMSCYGGSVQNFITAYPRGKPQFNIVGEMGVAYDWRAEGQVQGTPSTWANTTNPLVGLVSDLWTNRGYDWALDFEPALDILTPDAGVCDAATPYLNVFTQAAIYSTVGNNYVLLDPNGPIPPVGVEIYLGGQQFTVTGNAGRQVVDSYAGIKITLSGSLEVGIGIGNLVRWQATPENPETEPTYACGGVWEASEAEKDTVKKFIDSMDGWMQRRGTDGAMVIRSGHYYEPTVIIGPDEVVSYSWDDFNTPGKIYNYIVPYFVCPAFDYNQIDTTPVSDEADIEVNGESSQDFKPDFVQSNGQVLRLANWRLQRLLKPVQKLTLKASGLRALGERFIRLQLGDSELSDLEDVVVEICGDTEIIDNGMHVTFQVREINPATLYVWDCYAQEGSGPAATAPSAPGGLAYVAPTITNVSSFTDSETEGGSPQTGERLAASIAPPTTNGVNNRSDLTWWLRWMVEGGNSWVTVGPVTGLGAGDVVIDTGFVPTAASIVVQAAYQTGGGNWSPWSASVAPTRAVLTPGGDNIEFPGGGGHLIEP
jgi:hypothetical protein